MFPGRRPCSPTHHPVPVPTQSLFPKQKELEFWGIFCNMGPLREEGVPSGYGRRLPQPGTALWSVAVA